MNFSTRLLTPIVLLTSLNSFSQNVGIGISLPKARLHVTDSSVLFSAGDPLLSVTPNTPINGAGARMLWYPGKAAFRTGYVDAAQWDKDNIGTFSFASGYGTTASNLFSTAMGRNTLASGTSSVSLGYFNIASGSNSLSLGEYNNASGNASTAIGSNNLATGFVATASGFGTIARADYSSTMGSYTKSRSVNSLVIGMYNDTTNTNRLFEIGNGIQDNLRANAVTVLTNGRTGIGTASPLARLHVADSSVLFAYSLLPDSLTSFAPPASGTGTRMMWYPAKGAFRAGTIFNNGWDKHLIGVNSFAAGWDVVANGHFSAAFGFGSRATADYTFTSGRFALASADYAVSMGYTNYATGLASISFGSANVSSGSSSFTAGANNHASHYASIAMGTGNESSNFYSVSIGDGNISNGQTAFALGRGNQTSGNYSFAIGAGSKTRGDVTLAAGRELIANSAHSTVLGYYNDSSDVAADRTFPQPTQRLFQIGNGQYAARSNALTLLHNGYLGLGVLNPATRLDVAGLNNWDLSNTEGDFRIGNSSYRIKMGIALGGGGAGAASIRASGGIDRLNLGAGIVTLLTLNGSSARVGIGIETPAEKLEVAGNVRANAFILSSDIRLKRNITPVQNSVALLRKLNGYNYYWKDSSIDPSLQSGLIAQEVETLFPHLVKKNEDGVLAVNYTGLIPVLIESIKTQQQQIDHQQQQIDELKLLVEKLIKK